MLARATYPKSYRAIASNNGVGALECWDVRPALRGIAGGLLLSAVMWGGMAACAWAAFG